MTFVNTSFSQEAQKGLIYSWDDFSKGLNTKSSSLGLEKGYGTICQNVDLSAEHKSLNKRAEIYSYGTMDTSEPATGLHRLYLKDGSKILIGVHGDEIEVGSDTAGTFTSKLALTTGDYNWQFVTWHDLIIGGDGYNQPIKGDGSDFTYLGTCFATSTAGDIDAGTYNYKIAFYTTTYTIIVDVASPSITIAGGDDDLDLTMIPIGPDTYGGEDITGRRIYRSETDGTGPYQELSNSPITNNTATTLTDSDDDGALGDAYPTHNGTTIVTWTPPKGKFCVVNNNRLFFANDPTTATDTGPSTIYHSKSGSHELFENTDYFNIRKNDGDEITFAKNLLGRLCIGKTNTIQYLNTDGDDPPNDWSISDPYSSKIGCSAPYSATNTPLGIVFLNWDGIYVFNGQNSKLLSDIITPTILDISHTYFKEAWGEFADNIYYLAYTSEEGSANDRLLKYNLITKAFSSPDIIDINCFTVFSGGNDWGALYAGSSTDGEVYTWVEGSTQSVSHSSYDDFTGTWDDMGYFQPIEGGNPQEAKLEIRENQTLDDFSATNLDDMTGDIDRPDTGGTYISTVMYMPGISAYNTLYWNETIPVGNDVYFQLRGGTTSANCTGAAWDATQYTTPAGSNISGETAYEYTQYRITMSTDDIDESPTVDYGYGYTVRLTYDLLADDMETTIPMEWESGFTSLKTPAMYKKTLRKVSAWLEGTSGELVLKFTTDENISDTFTIDLTKYGSYYEEYFSEGGLTGHQFKLNISNSDMYPLKIKRVEVMGDVEPLI